MNQQPLQILRDWINTQGPGVCDDPRRVEAYLKDFCGQHKREIFVLVQAIRQNVVADLRQGPTPPFTPEIFQARLAQRLHDNLGLSEDIARWTVAGWCEVLGIAVAAPAQTTPTPKKKATRSQKAVASPHYLYGWIAAIFLGYIAFAFFWYESNSHQSSLPQTKTISVSNENRYEISENGEEVTDHKTGLIWRRAVEPGEFTWDGAKIHAQEVAQQTGLPWRVPTIDELKTLIDEKRKKRNDRPVIDTNFFPERVAEWFWSSSPYVGYTYIAWYVSFFDGDVYGNFRYSTFAVRLVRGG